MENYYIFCNKKNLKLRNLFGQAYSQIFQNEINLLKLLHEIIDILDENKKILIINKTFIILNKYIEEFILNINTEISILNILINQNIENKISKYDFKKQCGKIINIKLFEILNNFEKNIFILNEKYKQKINFREIKEIMEIKEIKEIKNIF